MTATVPVAGWLSVVSGSGDACMNGQAHSLEFGYGFGHAEGRGCLLGFGTGCSADEIDDTGLGRGDGNACHEEIEF